MTYYNEFDPKAAAWLQQLIEDKQIPYGYVDSRSILEVHPSDLSGFVQCHFFAGVVGWGLALRLAGWPNTEPVWTASLPCQPFSTAGKQLGTDDERHLAPVFLELVRQCRPKTIFGEQVASKGGREWFGGAPDLPKLRTNEALLRVLCELQGVGSEHMQRMLQAGIREIETASRIEKALRELQPLSEAESCEGSCRDSKEQSETERYAIQLGCTGCRGDQRADQEGLLPDVSSSFQPERRKNMGFPVVGPDRQLQGVCERECPSDPILPERNGERMGDGESDESVETHGCGSDRSFSESSGPIECSDQEECAPSFFAGIRYELEGMGYETGCTDTCAPCAGEIGEGRIVRGDQESWERVIVGKPHIRQRLYWVAYANRSNESGICGSSGKGVLEGDERRGWHVEVNGDVPRCADDGVANTDSQRRAGIDPLLRTQEAGADGDECSICGLTYADECECPGPTHDGYEYAERDGVLYARWVGDAGGTGPQGHSRDERDGGEPGREHPQSAGSTGAAGWTLLPCRDGKTRRTQSTLLWVAPRFPCGMVPSGDKSSSEVINEEERNQIDATSTTASIGQEMQRLRKTDDSEDKSGWEVGGPNGFRGPEVLQSDVHGCSHGGSDQSAQRQEWEETSNQDKEGRVRGMQTEHYETPRSSQRWESSEQFSREFSDFVWLLSSEMSLATLYGVSPTTKAVQALLERCDAEGFMLHPPDAAAEAWRSYSSEEREQVWFMVRESGLTIDTTHPLVNGFPRGVVPSGDPGAPEYANATAEARAARLKGYGNAIQIDTAVLFIKSCMEAIDA